MKCPQCNAHVNLAWKACLVCKRVLVLVSRDDDPPLKIELEKPNYDVAKKVSHGNPEPNVQKAEGVARHTPALLMMLGTPSCPPSLKNGILTIPFNADPKYHWWRGGQSLTDTLVELGADLEVIENYYWHWP
jgi:hypothetical protein